MTEVIMPKMGDGMEEGTLVEWLVKDGDKVKSGQIIGNIQTDKATLELEAPGSGTITGFLIQPGATVPVGVPIAAILKTGETIPADWGSGEPKKSAPAAKDVESASVAAPAAASSTPMSTERVKASPLAKKVADSLGIDLTTIQGSGPGGRIVEADVRHAKPGSGKAPASTPIAAPVSALASTAEDKRIPLNRLRQVTAQRTTQAKQTVPHFYVTVEVDCEKILGLREMFEEEGSGKVSINDFVVAASVRALTEMPEVNACFDGDAVIQYGAIHIGVAAAIDEGLMVPVIKNAHTMGLRQLSAATKDLVSRAKAGKLNLDEMQGSTFSISNMGMLNVDNFTAIINAPNAAIVAVSSAKRIPVVVGDDELEIRTVMNLTGSFDHRVVDGAGGAKFMNILRDFLQNPTRLLG